MRTAFWIMLLSMSAGGLQAADASKDAAALLEKTGLRGGLALTVGDPGADLALGLASKSALYVQALVPDAAAREAAAQKLVDHPNREHIGLRMSAFVPAHYDDSLFNLIWVHDEAALGKATLADLHRLLVPGGHLAVRGVPAGFADQAKTLKMPMSEASGDLSVFLCPDKPEVWQPTTSLKWQAGPRAQIANGFNGLDLGGGKLFYIEQTETDEGDLKKSASQLVARDAYNGRMLWSRTIPGGYNRYVDAHATRAGRLFVRTGDLKVHGLDGHSGETLFTVSEKIGRETHIRLMTDEFLLVGTGVHSTETGKLIWKVPTFRYQPLREIVIGENAYFCDGTKLMAKKLATGEELWTKPVDSLNLPRPYASLGRAGDHLLVRLKGEDSSQYAIALVDSQAGKMLWSYDWKVRTSPKERYFSANNVRTRNLDGELMLYYRHNKHDSYADEIVVTKLDLKTGKETVKDRVLADAGDYHGCFGEVPLGDYIAYYDLWVHTKELSTIKGNIPHPACFFGMKTGYGQVYNFPSRKSGPITAVARARDLPAPELSGPALRSFGSAPAPEATKPEDWTQFRGQGGGNATPIDLGTDLKKAWEQRIGVAGTDFGLMSSERTGVTQAAVGYGLVYVSDIEGQRVVALDAATGAREWVYHVGGRVDYPPALYKGLCLVAARDGCVHTVNARTGKPVYILRIARRERFRGGWDKLESTGALSSDVMIAGGVAYVSGAAFKPETGVLVETKDASAIVFGKTGVEGGRDLQFSFGDVIKGNSIPRTNEDNKHGFHRRLFGRKLDARVLAFDDPLTVAYQFTPKGEGWANQGTLTLSGITDHPAKPVWKTEPIELVVSDIVLGPAHVYCAGHYQRVKKAPELWVLSREDGKVVQTIPLEDFPAFMGMSASGKRLYVATRDGKLICFEGQ